MHRTDLGIYYRYRRKRNYQSVICMLLIRSKSSVFLLLTYGAGSFSNIWYSAGQASLYFRTRRFITAFSKARHCTLSRDISPVQTLTPYFCNISFNIIPRVCLGLPSGLRSFGFPSQILYHISVLPYKLYAQPISSFVVLSSEQCQMR